MHELGVVFHIIKEVEDVATANNVKSIKSVTLNIGEVSTIVCSYLEDCWNWAIKKSDVLKDAKLNINVIKAVTICEDCKKKYETVKFGKTCPYCGSENTYLKCGNETIIKEIAVQDD